MSNQTAEPAVQEPESYRGTFIGWKMPNGMKSVAGPFEVEVWKNRNPVRPRWEARILPTQSRIVMDSSIKKPDAIMSHVSSLFESSQRPFEAVK